MIDLTSAFMAISFAFILATFTIILAVTGAAAAALMRRMWRSR